jgi:osmoprotectant transport system permease protein
VISPPGWAARHPALLFPIRVHNQVLLGLVIAGIVAVSISGFISYAPNRLVSGEPVPLWAAADRLTTAGMIALGSMLLLASLNPPQKRLHYAVAVLSALLLLTGVVAAGRAANVLTLSAKPGSRILLGPAFWTVAACTSLAVVDALQRLAAGTAERVLAVVGVGSGLVVIAVCGVLDALSLMQEYESHKQAFAQALVRHVTLVAASVIAALAIGFPLGVYAARLPRFQGPVFAVLNILQTIPSIALFGLLIVPLSSLAAAVPLLAALGIGGIGVAPAIIALVLYALLPIVRNTSAGLLGVDRAAIDAGRGMGLTGRQIFWQVELPLSLPVLLAGLRIVIVQAIGLAVVAALIGAGGLGSFVFEGLGQYAVDLVLLGALPAIFLALGADFLLQTVAAILRRQLRG